MIQADYVRVWAVQSSRMPLTKAELRQKLEETQARLREAEGRLEAQDRERVEQLAEIQEERDGAVERAEEAAARLSEVEAELKSAVERAEAWQPENERLQAELTEVSHELESVREEMRDEIDHKEFQLREGQKEVELAVARAWEQARETHKREVDARDDLITMLKEKIESLRKGGQARLPESGPSTEEVGSGLGSGSQSPEKNRRQESGGSEPSTLSQGDTGSRPRLSLPSLTMFSGESMDDDGAFDRWLRKFERYAQLEHWSSSERLAQLELHLSGRAEKLYELLSADCRHSFEAVIEALRKHLTPVCREPLLSAELIKRKQHAEESVDAYA